MSLNNTTQTVIAFKNLLGKSNTDISKGVNNEAEGLFFNVDSTNVWISKPNPNPIISLESGDAVLVKADLFLDPTSNGHSYFTIWPNTPPSGVDIKTNLPFAYGIGILSNISAGDRVKNTISPSYGSLYEVKPYDISSNIIAPGDTKNWVYQYNSGIFFQQDKVGSVPSKIDVYVYTGEKLSDQSSDYSNIKVTATGLNEYIGLGDPTIIEYSQNHIYLVSFEETNTSSVFLNIDGLDIFPVVSFDSDGNVSELTGGEIINNQTYYLIWNGNEFQIFNSYPISTSSLTYTNLINVPINHPVDHMRGMTFQDRTMKEMWDMLLYPYQVPNFSSFSFNHNGIIREVGNPINSGTYSFTWSTSNSANILPNTIKITDLTSSNIFILNSINDGLEDISISEINKNTQSNHKWEVSAQRSNGTIMKTEHQVSWMWRKFFGKSSLVDVSSDNNISIILTELNSQLSTTILGSYNLPSGGYKYFSWQVSLGIPSLFRDFNTNLAVSMADQSDGYNFQVGSYHAIKYNLINQFGVSTDYYLFRSKNILGSSITIVVS
jgi:hypothetical protein